MRNDPDACKRSSRESAATFVKLYPGGLELEPWQTRLLAAIRAGAPVKVSVSRLGSASMRHTMSGYVPSGIFGPATSAAVTASRREAERAYRAAIVARQRQAAHERFLAEIHRAPQAGHARPKNTRRG